MSLEDDSVPESSRLGTKEYWDSHYDQELRNYEETQDEGEIWFGKQAETRAVEYILAHSTDLTRVIDIGCGNGHFLRRLRQRRRVWSALIGTDYSEASIALCTRIEKEEPEEDTVIEYEVVDILAAEKLAGGAFDILHDKGTWDAISLGTDREARRVRYARALRGTLKEGGLAVVVSCNYTTAELRAFFEGDGLQFVEELPEVKTTNAFSFGGVKGSTYSTAVFKNV